MTTSNSVAARAIALRAAAKNARAVVEAQRELNHRLNAQVWDAWLDLLADAKRLENEASSAELQAQREEEGGAA